MLLADCTSADRTLGGAEVRGPGKFGRMKGRGYSIYAVSKNTNPSWRVSVTLIPSYNLIRDKLLFSASGVSFPGASP